MTEQTSGTAQQQIAHSNAPNLCVIAPPGCGKTELLAMRADALIPRLRPHQRILALTFTNRAKSNLSERLRRVLGAQRFQRHVTVRNFHEHGAKLLQAHGKTIRLDPSEWLPPTKQTLPIALRQLSGHADARRATTDLLASVKRLPLDDDAVLAAVAADPLATQVEQERVRAGQLHYDDLLRHAQRLLRIEAVAKLYHEHFGAVLVDEFQDLTGQQLDVVLRTCVGSRTFVGDPLQGIFSFAGADPDHIEAELRKLCGDPVPLTQSHRSSPAVLAMLNSIAVPLGAATLTAYDPSDWPGGGVAVASAFDTQVVEAAAVASVAAHIMRAAPKASVGIITRTKFRRALIDAAFDEWADAPVRRWDQAIDDPDIVERIRHAVGELPRGASVADARVVMEGSLDAGDVDTAEELQQAFTVLAEENGGNGSVREALRRLRPATMEVNSAVEPGVHLLNAHTGKGQQFDWVFVCGLEEGQLPYKQARTPDAVREEQRVLLVMLSRARHGVVVTRSKTEPSWSSVRHVAPSRWFSALADASTVTGPNLRRSVEALYADATAPEADVPGVESV